MSSDGAGARFSASSSAFAPLMRSRTPASRDRLELRACGQAIKPKLARRQNRLLRLQLLLHHLLVGQEPFQLRLEGAGVVVGAMDVAIPPRAPVLDAALDGVGAFAETEI